MSSHSFLSDSWLEAVAALQQQYREQLPASQVRMRANQVITGAPFADGGSVHFHIDTTEGPAALCSGHVESPDVTITTDYDTAKALFLQQDQQAIMQAFMQGKIKVQGDMSKIMVPPPPKNDAQRELDEKIRAFTQI